MKPLGAGSIAVYDAIEQVYSLEGHSPGFLQIMAMTGFASKSTIAHHLDRLEQAGWIIREHFKVHAIIPVKYPRVYYRRRVHHDTAGMYPTHSSHADLDRFTQRDPFTDVHREWKPKSNP